MAGIAHINPRILRWAAERAGIDAASLAGTMKKDVRVLDEWMQGNSSPTLNQAKDLARRTHVPFGYLFLDAPPDDDLPIPDFRRLRSASTTEPSVDLREVIADVLRKQEWYAEYRQERDEGPLDFVGRFSIGDDPVIVAAHMADAMSFSSVVRPESQMAGFLRLFGRAAESVGVLVMRSGIVKQNTHRALDVREFRGFAISDQFAPCVFVNGNDAQAAQVFTLAHELAHVWIGATGISDSALTDPKRATRQEDSTETFCNRVAGELLLPWRDLQRQMERNLTLDVLLREVAREFHVSTVMVARQLWEHNAITRDVFFELYAQESANWILAQDGASSGGNFYATAGIRNSRRFSEAVLESMGSTRTTVREASRLLGVKPVRLERLHSSLGGDV